MKTKVTTILVSSIFALATTTASAASLTPNEIFSAIDGEHNHVEDASHRVNFDLSSADLSSDLLNHVLSGIDSEYEYKADSSSRVNFSLDASDDGGLLNHVLSGIDGEGDY